MCLVKLLGKYNKLFPFLLKITGSIAHWDKTYLPLPVEPHGGGGEESRNPYYKDYDP